jgi:SAM-dependent methyltransferase
MVKNQHNFLMASHHSTQLNNLKQRLRLLLSPADRFAHAEAQAITAKLNLAEWNQIYWKFNAAETVYRTVNGQQKIGGAKKYLNLKHFLPFNIKRYHSLNLPTQSLAIADLGCGAGYFAFYAILQGHFVLVLDRDAGSDHFDSQGQQAFDMMTDFFKLPKVKHTILPFQHLPSELDQLDLITGFNTWFDGRYEANRTYVPWTLDEWRFFLEDCKGRLRTGGRLHLELNEKWEIGKNYFHVPGLQALFEQLGFKINQFVNGVIDVNVA